MNAIELLKQDHEKVKKLLEDISNTTERAFKKRAELLQKGGSCRIRTCDQLIKSQLLYQLS